MNDPVIHPVPTVRFRLYWPSSTVSCRELNCYEAPEYVILAAEPEIGMVPVCSEHAEAMSTLDKSWELYSGDDE